MILDLQHILGAIDLHRLHGLSFWDVLVLRAAADAGCTTLFSEDLNPGERIDGIEIMNPFRGDRVALEAVPDRSNARL